MFIVRQDWTILSEVGKQCPSDIGTEMNSNRMDGATVPKDDTAFLGHDLVRLDRFCHLVQRVSKRLKWRPVRFVSMRSKHAFVASRVDRESSVAWINIIEVSTRVQLLTYLIGVRTEEARLIFYSALRFRLARENDIDAADPSTNSQIAT